VYSDDNATPDVLAPVESQAIIRTSTTLAKVSRPTYHRQSVTSERGKGADEDFADLIQAVTKQLNENNGASQ
jgi:hypothetical protein